MYLVVPDLHYQIKNILSLFFQEHAGRGIVWTMAWAPYCLHFDHSRFHQLLPAFSDIWKMPHCQALPGKGCHTAEKGGSSLWV